MLTWSQFVARVKVHLTVDAARVGAEDLVAASILIAAQKIQEEIESYRSGNTYTFEHDDATRDGFASVVSIPTGAYIREVYHSKLTEPGVERPAYWYPHLNRRDLVFGAADARSSFKFTVNPQQTALTVYPALAPGYGLKLVWDGVSESWSDSDATPFTEQCAEAASKYVKARIKAEVENNPQLATYYDAQWLLSIRHLKLQARERVMEQVLPYSSAQCVPGCGCVSSSLIQPCAPCGTHQITGSAGCVNPTTLPSLEWVMFGDSGDPATLSDSDLVSSSVRALNPQLIFHLGDTNYPTGSDTTVGDRFVRHFWSWIRSGDLFAAYGNHDLMTNYGSPLTGVLLAQQAAIGATKITDHRLWYQLKRGPVEFFVLNSGLDDSDSTANFSAQYTWLRAALLASTSTWKVVVLHRAPYTSDAVHYPGTTAFRWTFKAWGADVVISAHGHTYERLLVDGLPYIVCGLGGAPRYAFSGSPLPQSQFRWADDVGFLRCSADSTTLQIALVNARRDAVIDRLTLVDSADGTGDSAQVGDNYQFKGGLLQLFNPSTGGFSTIRITGPSNAPTWSADVEGSESLPVNFRWATPTCLQLWNATASTWHPVFLTGPDGAATFAIGQPGEVGDTAKIENYALLLRNTTTESYRPIYFYGIPPTIAIG